MLSLLILTLCSCGYGYRRAHDRENMTDNKEQKDPLEAHQIPVEHVINGGVKG